MNSDHRQTIMLVDDDPQERKHIGDLLTKFGYHVHFAGNGVEALLSTDNRPVDLIILDLLMPIMNGFETLHYLRQHRDTRDVPVILIANNQSGNTIQLPGVKHVLNRQDLTARTLRQAIESSIVRPSNPVTM